MIEQGEEFGNAGFYVFEIHVWLFLESVVEPYNSYRLL